SRFSHPNSAAPFPLNLSPSIVSVYSTVISLSMNFRTAVNVRVPSFSFRSLRFASFWSGQLIVPASLSPSFLIFRVDSRFCPPMLYSHFHVPVGSAFLSWADESPTSPSASAAAIKVRIDPSPRWAAGEQRPSPRRAARPPTGVIARRGRGDETDL